MERSGTGVHPLTHFAHLFSSSSPFSFQTSLLFLLLNLLISGQHLGVDGLEHFGSGVLLRDDIDQFRPRETVTSRSSQAYVFIDMT